MKQVALAEIKDDLSRYLREASNEELVITRHGKPAGVLVGFASEDDWLDYNLENNPGFLNRIATARAALERGEGISLSEYKRRPALAANGYEINVKFDEQGRAIFTPTNLEQVTACVLKKLQEHLKERNIKAARVFSRPETVKTDFYRIRRAKPDFPREFDNTLKQLVALIIERVPDDWKNMALELAYSDGQDFKPNGENMFAEYMYLGARMVKVESK